MRLFFFMLWVVFAFIATFVAGDYVGRHSPCSDMEGFNISPLEEGK